jgi:hypothetical protein
VKKLFFLLTFLIVTLSLKSTTYYIDPAGNNSHTGLISSPWLTLAYACAHTTSGDIIHVNAGTFTETVQCTKAVGVSIEGVGVTSHIISQVVFTRSGDLTGAAIMCSSASEGTNDNSHISGIWLDGNYYAGSTGSSSATGNDGIFVQRRSNVKIFNCTISGFYLNGIALHGSTIYAQPSIYATGNEIHDCIITDNGNEDSTWGGGGNIEIGGQGDGTLIHDNTISCIGRQNHGLINGNNLSGAYHNEGVKFYNNLCYKNEQESVWSFHIEMWNTDGGMEAYGNTFNGGDTGIDIAGDWSTKGSYAYSWYVHDNLFTGNYLTSHEKKIGIDIENGTQQDIWIYRNHFYQKHAPFNITNGDDASVVIQRVWIAYNIMESCGYGVPGGYQVINNIHLPGDMTLTDFYFCNNVIIGEADAYYIGFDIDNAGTITNMYFRNNIIVNFLHSFGWLYVANAGSMNGLYVNNNIQYNNSNSNDPLLTGNSVSNYSYTNATKTAPPFVSSTDFHLTAARNGVAVSFPITWADYDGNTLASPPEMGVYEYGTISAPTVTTTAASNIAQTTTTSGGNVTADGGATVTARGVCWGTSANPITSGSHTSDGTGTGTFASSIIGLTAYTIYHVRAYATNSQGISYGSDVQFTTSAAITIPVVTTTAITSITITTATSGGTISSDGGSTVTAKGVCWGISTNPTTSGNHTSDISGTSTFTSAITGLTAGTVYHVRAYASNGVGTAYGSDVRFTSAVVTSISPVTHNGVPVISGGKILIITR